MKKKEKKNEELERATPTYLIENRVATCCPPCYYLKKKGGAQNTCSRVAIVIDQNVEKKN